MITLLLLVGCNKEERSIKGDWKVIYHGVKYIGTQSWQDVTWNSPNLTVTKNTWEPYIEGKCIIEGEHIIPENYTEYTYSYNYSEISNELKLNVFDSSGNWIKKLIFERI